MASGTDPPDPPIAAHATVGVRVGKVQVGGGAPVVVQSMSNTDTADVDGDGPAVRSSSRRRAPSSSASP